MDKNNSLSILFPQRAKLWHPTKNHPLTPIDVAAKSGKKVWWKCEKNHEWIATIDKIAIGRNCPYCSGKKVCNDNCLATLKPELINEWSLLNELSPYEVTKSSGKKVWWKCEKNHEWQARISDRFNGSRCPYCCNQKVKSTNSLSYTHPQLSKEWHSIKNIKFTPNQIVAGSNKKVWWKCPIADDHIWQASPNNRTSQNSGCPCCSGHKVCKDNSLATLFPKISKEWHNSNLLSPHNFTSKSI